MKGLKDLKTVKDLRAKMQEMIDYFDASEDVTPAELELLDGMTAVNKGTGVSTIFATVGYMTETLSDYDTSLTVDGKIAAATVVADTDTQAFVLNANSPFAPVLATETTLVCDATDGAIVINLPAVATVPGKTFFLYKNDSVDTLTINCDGAEIFIGTGGGASSVVLTAATDFVSIQAITDGGSIVGWLIKDGKIT